MPPEIELPFRKATVFTLAVTAMALWFSIVESSLEPLDIGRWPLSWISPAATSVILVSILYLCVLAAIWTQNIRHRTTIYGAEIVVVQFIAVLLAIGALLGLIFALNGVLWGKNPPETAYLPHVVWGRWIIVGGVILGLLAASGRAAGCALLGGLIWLGMGICSGVDKTPLKRVDEILVALFVGTLVGAIVGTLARPFLKLRRLFVR
jgi:hypothetical protein